MMILKLNSIFETSPVVDSVGLVGLSGLSTEELCFLGDGLKLFSVLPTPRADGLKPNCDVSR